MSFNSIAPYYDLLADIVSFRRIYKSQLCYLDKIAPNSRILIIGGGTGKFLKELVSKNCEITYVELSDKMIENAKKNVDAAEVNFICADFSKIILPNLDFDVVIAYYFFDVYNQEKLPQIIQKVYNVLKPKGILLVADFNTPSRFWQKIVMNAMKVFFKLFAKMPFFKHPNIRQLLSENGFLKQTETSFFGGFIFSYIGKKAIQPNLEQSLT